MNAEIMKAMQAPEVIAKYQSIGVDPVQTHTPEAFRSFLQNEVKRWAQVVKDANIKPQ